MRRQLSEAEGGEGMTDDFLLKNLCERVERLTVIVKGFEAEMLNLRDEMLLRWDAQDKAARTGARYRGTPYRKEPSA